MDKVCSGMNLIHSYVKALMPVKQSYPAVRKI
jgi:hypothetical protein